MLESDFNKKWDILMDEIANSNSTYKKDHFVKIGTYNIFRFMTKYSKVGYDCLICWPVCIMELGRKSDRVVIMKNELFYYCNHGWSKKDQFNQHLDKLKGEENSSLLSWEDCEYIFNNSEELTRLFRERECVSHLLDYFLK